VVSALAAWHDEHARFGRVLDLLETQVSAFHAGEDPDYELMRDIVYYLQNFADRFHHPREDAAFERLAQREPSLRVMVNRLLQEHRVIARAGEELLGRLADIAGDVIVERAAVEAAASTYLVYYRHHIKTEEAEVLPSAAQILTPEDWAAVAAAVPPGPDPLFGPDFDARYEALRKQVTPDASAP
jgi:hemerythrin-like domain-containing protein